LRQPVGEIVDALLHERIDSNYARAADDKWLAYLDAMEGAMSRAGATFTKPENYHWRWHPKVGCSSHLLSCPTLAVECDSEAQGFMLLKTDGHFAQLVPEKGKPLVYIPFLATAPWNQRGLADQPRFSGVGTILLRAAITISLDAEFKGRIGLHSLPQAEGFYECHGFHCLGVDPDKENLKYYELSPAKAAEFMK
jgi:hypothetical protein